MFLKVLVNPLRGTCSKNAGRGLAAIAALALVMTPAVSAQASFFLPAATGGDATAWAESVVPNQFCQINGPTGGSCGSAMVFTATSPAQPSSPFTATFSFLNNTSGASFIGSNSCVGVTSCSVVVNAGGNGSFVIKVILSFSGGVQKTCQQLVTVTDNTPPVITCPQNVTVPCGNPTDPTVTGTATVADCSPYTLTFTDAPGTPGCVGVAIIRTWLAIDSQGLSATCTQTITVNDPALDHVPGPGQPSSASRWCRSRTSAR